MSFLRKLINEVYEAELEEQEVSKNLAKEDALTLIAEFVKDVKKRFTNSADRTEILDAALKTLEFFINEIDKEEVDSIPDDSFGMTIDAEDESGFNDEEDDDQLEDF